MMINKGYNVQLVDLPVAVRGFITYDGSGDPLILINARLDRAAQKRALDHEIDHDKHGDMTSEASIYAVESRQNAS